MISQLLKAMDASDQDRVSELIKNEITGGNQAWKIHLALFPLVQRVQNPPFINPHLPKMYRICREFLPYLRQDDIPALVKLEIYEYTKRPKLKELPEKHRENLPVSFQKIKAAIREGDPEKVAALLNAFQEQKGKEELAKNLLLLGSGYLDQSLGHSVSCTAFILLEMIERSDQDPWPALAVLADYFCKGKFHTAPPLRKTADLSSEDVLSRHLLRAASGSGLLNLHHTITRYSIERVRHLLSEAEYAHMIACWIEFMGDKEAEIPPPVSSAKEIPGYDSFFQIFSKREEKKTLSCLAGMISSKGGRRQLGRYLVKGVCDMYQGNYNPHFLTGLGSALWVVDQYHEQAPIAMNTLRQYLNYFLTQS